jgi:hypothetical protein
MVLDCIESWKNHCPDYEIREWGRQAVLDMNNRFATEALENKKWAFASDVLRLWVLREHGGLYMDSDLLVTAPIDRFLENRFFTGFETYRGNVTVAGWFLAAEKGCEVVSDLLAEYDAIPFVHPDGSFDMVPNTSRIARYFSEKFALDPPYDATRSAVPAPGVTIYPTHFFCAPEPGLENYTIHLFNGAWLDKYERKHYGSLGRLEFARFKRTEKRSGKLPLREGEKLLFTIPTRLSGEKRLAVILRPRW